MIAQNRAKVKSEAIPPELKGLDHWITWRQVIRDGKPTKLPMVPSTNSPASSTDPSTWRTFEEALADVESDRAAGVGFIFTDSVYAGVDLDFCLDGEKLDPWAAEIVEALDSYTEVSPSGDGLHVIVKGKLPPGRRRKDSIEMYDSGRFFTVTGEQWPFAPDGINERTAQLKSLHAALFPPTDTGGRERPATPQPNDLDDEELIQKAMAVSNGARFRRLWEGNITSYPSQSEADLALCAMLAFWTGGDQRRVDQLYRRSGLMREKWRRADYRTGTIAKALEGCTEFYTPGHDTSEGKDERRRKPPMKDQVLKLALAEDIALFCDQHGTPYCRTPRGGHYENLAVDSPQFADWLGWLLYVHDGRTCSDQTLEPGRRVLRAKARFEGDTYRLHNRVAWGDDGALYYDLSGDEWRAIRVTAAGWQVDPGPPILFRRYAHQQPQVEPERVTLDEAVNLLREIFPSNPKRGAGSYDVRARAKMTFSWRR